MTPQAMAELLLRDMADRCQEMALNQGKYRAMQLLDLSDRFSEAAMRIWEKQWEAEVEQANWNFISRNLRIGHA